MSRQQRGLVFPSLSSEHAVPVRLPWRDVKKTVREWMYLGSCPLARVELRFWSWAASVQIPPFLLELSKN